MEGIPSEWNVMLRMGSKPSAKIKELKILCLIDASEFWLYPAAKR
jgi:hypothetical protein